MQTKRQKCLLLVVQLTILMTGFTAIENTTAEPWIDTRDSWLRADIERLSQAGIITVPITTWPLMWSGILNDLERAQLKSIKPVLQDTYARVLSAGKRATRSNQYHQSARLSLATESQLFRHYGDNAREEGELSVRRNGMTDHFAYNLELTRTQNPWDGDDNRFDNSYFGVVAGNWIALAGRVEKWWGPGWSSNLLLTNNARPTFGLTLQRNYSDPFDFPVLEWFGPWTTNIFISELDDERHINNAKLVGMTVGFRPIQSLEINLRRGAQWGGDGRPQSFNNFVKLVLANSDNCPEQSCKPNEPGNQIAGADFRWDLPWYDLSVYGQMVGEDGSGSLPSKRAYERGVQYSFSSEYIDGMLYAEYSVTSATAAPEGAQYNVFYNHSIYQTGYRYEGRVIGATWDNDSSVTTLGLIGHLSNGDTLEARMLSGTINEDSFNSAPSAHSITNNGGEFNALSARWRRTFGWGELQVETAYTDERLDQHGRQDDEYRIGATAIFRFD